MLDVQLCATFLKLLQQGHRLTFFPKFESQALLLLFHWLIWSKVRAHRVSPFSCHSGAVCVQGVCPGWRWRHTLLKARQDQLTAPGTIAHHSWMGSCFQTSLLQPATHILQAILMFLESPPKNNHIIQIS